MTQNTDTIETWRDLTDKLTPQQIAGLEAMERVRVSDAVDYREWLIGEAREYIAENEHDAELSARVQPPAGATSVDGWGSIDSKTGRPCRSIQWSSHDAGRTAVDIDGWQDDTGEITERGISVYGMSEGESLTAADAVKLAAALLKAADVLRKLETPVVDMSRNW